MLRDKLPQAGIKFIIDRFFASSIGSRGYASYTGNCDSINACNTHWITVRSSNMGMWLKKIAIFELLATPIPLFSKGETLIDLSEKNK